MLQETDSYAQAIFPVSRFVSHPDEDYTSDRADQRVAKLAIRWAITFLIVFSIHPLRIP